MDLIVIYYCSVRGECNPITCNGFILGVCVWVGGDEQTTTTAPTVTIMCGTASSP